MEVMIRLKTISGVKIFIDKNKGKDDFILNLFGDENKITKLIQSKNIPTQSLKIIFRLTH